MVYNLANKKEGGDVMSLIKCPECGKEVSDKADFCIGCGYPIKEHLEQQEENNDEGKDAFNGIYKYPLLGNKQKVYCPRCKSTNCSWYTEQKIIPGKTKARYTANLNPLHPFTLVNKKEKVVKKESVKNVKKIMCNNCGYTFS